MKLSIEQIKEMAKPITTVKYVRVGDKDFRFAKPDSWTQHTDLLGVNEIPVSAGFFIYFDKEIHMQKTPSTTLNMGPMMDDKKLLEELFNG